MGERPSASPQLVDTAAASIAPPIPAYIRQYLASAGVLASSKRRRRESDIDGPHTADQEVRHTNDGVRSNAELFAAVQALVGAYRNVVRVLGDAPVSSALDEAKEETSDFASKGTPQGSVDAPSSDSSASATDETDAEALLRTKVIQQVSHQWVKCVSDLGLGIRSKRTVCVKRSVRDRLCEEIAEKQRAVNKMESTIETVKHMA